jgi:hypothetical protein
LSVVNGSDVHPFEGAGLRLNRCRAQFPRKLRMAPRPPETRRQTLSNPSSFSFSPLCWFRLRSSNFGGRVGRLIHAEDTCQR